MRIYTVFLLFKSLYADASKTPAKMLFFAFYPAEFKTTILEANFFSIKIWIRRN